MEIGNGKLRADEEDLMTAGIKGLDSSEEHHVRYYHQHQNIVEQEVDGRIHFSHFRNPDHQRKEFHQEQHETDGGSYGISAISWIPVCHRRYRYQQAQHHQSHNHIKILFFANLPQNEGHPLDHTKSTKAKHRYLHHGEQGDRNTHMLQ